MPILNEQKPIIPDPLKQTSSTFVHWVIFIVIGVLVIGGAWYFRADLGIDTLVNGITNRQTNTNSVTPVPQSASSVSAQLAAQGELRKFDSVNQIAGFLETRTQENGDLFVTRNAANVSDSGTPSSTFGLGEANLMAPISEYSSTNVQVSGVDEADIVKTDGNYIYAVAKNNIYIIDATPAKDMAIVSTIALSVTPQDVYITGDSLVIYGLDTKVDDYDSMKSILRETSQFAFVKVFSIADKKNPKQIRDLDFEGSVLSSRMIGDYVYLVTSTPSFGIEEEYPIPIIMDGGTILPMVAEGGRPCNCPDVWYVDMPYASYHFTNVSAINVKDVSKSVTNTSYLLGAGEEMYVSVDNMYIAYTKYVNELTLSIESMKELLWPKISVKDQQRILEIEAASPTLLSQNEKIQKVMAVLQRQLLRETQADQNKFQNDLEAAMKKKYQDISKELEKTVVHKIALDKGALTYKGAGEVTGHILNQFSMDESEGYFRIATTKSRTWSQFTDDTKSYSNVYVLDADLKVVGKVENLAENEQIYSARFMGKRAYLVTFRQTDPLFAIDLSNPKAPKVLGELKVPGFSSYLHPYDETTLIGFGKDADSSGSVKGLKLSLFDVSDVANMKEVDTYTVGDRGSDSIALSDHKAFLFSKDKELLVIPVTIRQTVGTNSYGNVASNGALVFKVTKSGFENRALIEHSDKTADDNQVYRYYDYSYYNTTVKRSLYIGNELFTLSEKYLKAHALGDLAETKSLTLTPGSTNDDYTIIR